MDALTQLQRILFICGLGFLALGFVLWSLSPIRFLIPPFIFTASLSLLYSLLILLRMGRERKPTEPHPEVSPDKLLVEASPVSAPAPPKNEIGLPPVSL